MLYHQRKHPEDAQAACLPHVAASYQEAVVDTLVRRVEQALASVPAAVRFADPALCAENAAMIAAAAQVIYRPLLPQDTGVDVVPSLAVDVR